MAVLKKQIGKRIKGSLQEREDWWHLCYDTERREFFVEHEWSHMNAYKVSAKADEGLRREAIEGYSGIGSDKIDQAKVDLLAEAGHA
ncbi:hypothetical protein [Pararhodobacter sp. SW119]|uniref:hypothetical protein n=1 Tax=Pararhodobacter sp. SW119 TaxID=2780075 RepID=UPI001AE032E5|nr:hypothetical protein [Pararhodobacter sp. SW119]